MRLVFYFRRMVKMKKITATLLAMVLVLGLFSFSAFAADASAQVYVTIALDDGNLAVAQEAVTVTDIDNDKKLTINDALYCVHEAFYPGGAAQGYKTELTQWGLGIKKLWNVSNGGSYGYYVNNTSAWSLTDTISAGDYINAFVYKDAQGFSDSYSYFSAQTVEATAYEPFEITLYRLTYDANWNTVEAPVAGAVIIVDGKTTDFVTDADGKATITLTKAGNHVLSAVSDSIVIVSPVCKADVARGSFLSMLMYYTQIVFSMVMAFISSLFGSAS